MLRGGRLAQKDLAEKEAEAEMQTPEGMLQTAEMEELGGLGEMEAREALAELVIGIPMGLKWAALALG